MTRLSVCGLGVSCNEMSDTPMLLVVHISYYLMSVRKFYRFYTWSVSLKRDPVIHTGTAGACPGGAPLEIEKQKKKSYFTYILLLFCRKYHFLR